MRIPGRILYSACKKWRRKPEKNTRGTSYLSWNEQMRRKNASSQNIFSHSTEKKLTHVTSQKTWKVNRRTADPLGGATKDFRIYEGSKHHQQIRTLELRELCIGTRCQNLFQISNSILPDISVLLWHLCRQRCQFRREKEIWLLFKSLFLWIHRQICQLCFLLFFIFECCICKKSDTCSFIMRLSVLASTVLNFPEESNETRWKYTCCCSFWSTLHSGIPHLGFTSNCWFFATEFLIRCLTWHRLGRVYCPLSPTIKMPTTRSNLKGDQSSSDPEEVCYITRDALESLIREVADSWCKQERDEPKHFSIT